MLRAPANIAVIAALSLVGACGPFFDAYDRNFDYEGASEEAQQKYLDGASKRFALGARIGGMGAFEVTQVFADASVDIMSVSVRSKHAYMDQISAEDVAAMKKDVTQEMCAEMAENIGLDKGYTVRMRFFKNSGAPLTIVEVNETACARYV